MGGLPAELDNPRYRLEYTRTTHRPRAGVASYEVSRSENRLFLPQSALDEWIVDGSVELEDGVLLILSEGRRFNLTEAVRVVGEVSGSGDAHDLVGRAKARVDLEQMGAEIVESSMLLGEAAYDTVPGWLGAPVGAFSDHRESASGKAAGEGVGAAEPKTDEDLLRRFLAKNA